LTAPARAVVAAVVPVMRGFSGGTQRSLGSSPAAAGSPRNAVVHEALGVVACCYTAHLNTPPCRSSAARTVRNIGNNEILETWIIDENETLSPDQSLKIIAVKIM
jgi:hypothetical protein